MSQQALLTRVIEALDQAGIEYMLTGSLASSLQGEPRSTHDIDVVITIEQQQVNQLLAAFPHPAYYVDEQAAREAIRMDGMFNVLDVEGGDKVDFWLLTDEPFDRSRFARKIEEEVFGLRLKVSAPEDTILAKLSWSKQTGESKRYYLDALRVYEVQAGGDLDVRYIDEWAKLLDVESIWQRLLAEAEEV